MICPLIRPQLFTLSLYKISYYEENCKVVLKVSIIQVQLKALFVIIPLWRLFVACLESLHHRNSWIS